MGRLRCRCLKFYCLFWEQFVVSLVCLVGRKQRGDVGGGERIYWYESFLFQEGLGGILIGINVEFDVVVPKNRSLGGAIDALTFVLI